MKKPLIILVLLFIIFACNKGRIADESKENSFAAMEIAAPGTDKEEKALDKETIPNVGLNQNLPQKLIYTANVRFRVVNLKDSETKIKQLVGSLKGYIPNSSQNNSDGNLNTTLTIRIPVEQFESFLTGSEKESIYTDFKNINSEDVSEEFYDNEIRIKSKRQAFEKYLSLLKQAKNVTEVMAVQEQIRIIQEEIESKEGDKNSSIIKLHIALSL